MKIHPQNKMVYIKMESAQAGVLNTSSRESAVEFAEVLAVGEECGKIKKGDTIFVKSWGIDIVTHNDVRYCFVSIDTGAILAIVHE